MTADGRVLLIIIIAGVFILVGRKIQQMLDMWQKWRLTVASIPGLRSAAWGGVRTMAKVGVAAAVVLWVVVNLNYFV